MAAAASGGAGDSTEGPSVTGGLLGLGEHDLDDLKAQATVLTAQVAKKPKLTHRLFFEEERGLKKVLQDFPKLKFKGKGREFEDLQVLMTNYRRWFKDIYPFEDSFEDLIWKARTCLQAKEKDDSGLESDPREQLHMLRFEYKNSGAAGTKGLSSSSQAASAPQVSDEAKKRIEENRKKALEIKRKRQADTGAAPDPLQAPAPTFMDLDDEDIFGFGGGLDRASGPGPTAMDEEDDVFGFGGGLDDDDDGGAPAPRPAAGAQDDLDRHLAAFPTEEAVAPTAVQPPAKAADPEVAKKVAANKARALEMKKKKQEAAAAAAAAQASTLAQAKAALPSQDVMPPTSDPGAATDDKQSQQAGPWDDMIFEDEEEDIFGFGGGLDG